MILIKSYVTLQMMSRPVWGAWIEIGYQYEDLRLTVVAPRMGRVD